MKSIFIRLSAILLVCLMLMGVAVSCTDGPAGGDGTTDGAGTTVPDSTADGNYDENGYLKDRIPDTLNYGGETVDILYWNNAKNVEFDAEDNGNTIDSAIYYRNISVENRIGVTLNWIGEKGDYAQRADFNNVIATDLSGDCMYDIISAYSTTIAMAATNGYALDLMECADELALDMPWWGADLTDMATINGKLFFATGDISTNYLLRMYGVFFNKELVEEHRLQSPYTYVNENNWTVDSFLTLAAAMPGVSDTSPDAVYGFVNDAITVEAIFYGSGLRFVDKDGDDVPYISDSWHGDTAQTLIDKFAAYCKTPSVLIDSKADESTFTQGKSLFIIYSLDFAMNYLPGTGVDFGIAPIPKYNSEQENYATTLNYKYSLYMISKATDIPEVAAYTLEALASESYRSVTPDLYEVAMKIRYVTDETSQTMIDYIRDGVSFEIGRTFTHVFEYETYRSIRKALAGTESEGWQSTAKTLNVLFKKQLASMLDSDAFKN